jgi:hypothetical protein
MMMNIKNIIGRSSSNQKNSKRARFVPIKTDYTAKFKYILKHRVINAYNNVSVSWKRRVNSRLQKPRLWLSQIEWNIVKEDTITWFIEAFIEGITLNFATHYLFDVPFTLMVIFAHGILVKQGISIYWRFKKDGSTSTIFKKNK